MIKDILQSTIPNGLDKQKLVDSWEIKAVLQEPVSWLEKIQTLIDMGHGTMTLNELTEYLKVTYGTK